MKRKSYFALALVVLCGLAVVRFREHAAPHFVGGFSPEDFTEIQTVIRHTLWQRAFSDFAAKTITAAPGSLWRLATCRIEQVDVFEGGTSCRVRVRTPTGIDLFAMQKSAPKPGQSNWRISSERASAGPLFIKQIEGYGAFAKLTVKDGSGLRGGKLPALFYTPAVYPERPIAPVPTGQDPDSRPVSVSYEPHRVFLLDDPQPTATNHDVMISHLQFSGWLSNHSELKLSP